MDLLAFSTLGLLNGWLAGRIYGDRGLQLASGLATGVGGAVLGGMLFSALRIGASGPLTWAGSLVTATVFSLTALFFMNVLKRA